MTARRGRRRRDVVTVVKDLFLFALGVSLIIKQGWLVTPEEFSWQAMLAGGLIAQVPGAMGFVRVLRTPGSASQGPPE